MKYPVAKPNTAAPAAGPKAAPAKPPKLALEGNKWVVENYTNDNSIVIDKTELRHVVYIFNCTNCTIQVKGKVNAVSVGKLNTFFFGSTNQGMLMEMDGCRRL
jgi:adenylyl cyclase-associated protein